jgi:hypothetical protein
MWSTIVLRIKNYRTTIAGVFTIAGTVITFVAQWATTGTIPDATHWNILGAGITTGAGLIAAADARTTARVVDKMKAEVSEIKEHVQEQPGTPPLTDGSSP